MYIFTIALNILTFIDLPNSCRIKSQILQDISHFCQMPPATPILKKIIVLITREGIERVETQISPKIESLYPRV